MTTGPIDLAQVRLDNALALFDEFVRQINEGLHMQSAFNVAMRTVRELTNASRQRDLHRLRHLSDVLITMCTILGITARD